MLIFGWGFQTKKDFGQLGPYLCNHCNNVQQWHLYRVTTWFTIFFIPIIPYSIEKFLICPICEHGIKLDGMKFDELKTVIEQQGLYSDEVISSESYDAKEEEIIENNNQMIDANQGNDKEMKKYSDQYCSQCGAKNGSESNFCTKCGNKMHFR
jgi:hypothetical protein